MGRDPFRGVDTIRVGGGISCWDPSAPWALSLSPSESGMTLDSARMKLPSGGVVDVRSGTAFVEASVPKYLAGENVEPATIGEARDVAGAMIREAREVVTFIEDPRRVTRLDCVRDFTDVPELAVILGGLSHTPLTGRKRRRLYNDPQRGAAETLQVGTKTAGGGTLYDKAKESGREDLSRLRFEARERTRSLNRAGVLFIEDINKASMSLLRARRFAWAGFDRPISSIDATVAAVVASDIPDGSKYQILGYLMLLERKLEVGNRYRRRRLEKLMNEHGIPYGLSCAPVVRLDLRRGVVRAAA